MIVRIFWFYFFGYLFASNGLIVKQVAGQGDEDIVEGEDEGQVEDEPLVEGESTESSTQSATSVKKDLDAEEEVKELESSPDVETTFIFTYPAAAKELPVGKLAKFLIGFYNKGEKDFIVNYSETSFRYPMDLSFYIQNFTLGKYERLVQPKQESTFDYSFFPPENFAGRPLGLIVNLRYQDSEGTVYESAVFNQTITLVEDDGGFNPETGFLYIVFACVVILLLLLGRQLLAKMRRKHGMAKKQTPTVPLEIGTTNKHEVDFEWIPKEVLNINKSPGRSPRNKKLRKAGDN